MSGPEASTPEDRDDLAELRCRQRRTRIRSLAGFFIGMGLLALAVWTVSRHGQTFSDGWAALRRAPAGMVALVLLLPLSNQAFTSASFWVLTNRYGRVRYIEMLGLVASATLLNQLPMRPGLVGRVAYHRRVHGIRVGDSIRVIVQVMICAGSAMGGLFAIAMLCRFLAVEGWMCVGLFAIPVLVGCGAWAGLSTHGQSVAGRWVGALLFRYLDGAVWTARYAIIFRLLGQEISLPAAAAVAFFSQVAMISPVQLGLREWMVGLASSLIPENLRRGSATGAASVAAMAPGLLADIVNRAAELASAIPVGVLATVVLYRRWRRASGLETGVGGGLNNPM